MIQAVMIVFVSWVSLVVAAILWRRAKGLPLFTGRPQGALFYSAGASGSSAGNPFALVIQQGLLSVAVTPEELRMGVAFPLNLTFIGQIADLEHRVPRRSVRASLVPGLMGEVALAEFTGSDGRSRAIRLRFNTPSNFVRAIQGAAG